MLPASFAPNLYEHFSLDSRATSRELGVQLAAADAHLEGLGYLPEAPEREELAVASRILCEPSSRASYDQKVESGAQLTWAQLEDYATTGRWGESAHAPTSTPPRDDARRASPGNRVLMAVIDYFLAALVVSFIVGFGFTNPDDNSVWIVSISSIFTVAYYICFEVLAGATPAKLIGGYTVRDVTTHEKLTWQQSIRRNWWRVASLVPLIGPLIAFFGALYVVTTIGAKNQLRGQHDIMANAEVVKK
ncbi:RDD family protein [Corynebacterium sp. HMSC072A04]|uniref:RDD family protein n=1 Tax=Corynebacterium sp. HMSC072A04 TaxID=1715045 RepID=UPI0008D5ED0F|nr:RDD family protein [Corynebacterium sp. HMSC072A04]OFN33990.1 hypothetical protein HMPREF2565_10875 [Corynebacterium sp. HMSC072A04]